ncbi:MAG: IS1096 element passenger TnpR family protein, partial [Egibacteraceae bacterium]
EQGRTSQRSTQHRPTVPHAQAPAHALESRYAARSERVAFAGPRWLKGQCMSDWMTIRVELLGRPGAPLEPTPGRIMLAHADHAFAELADGIDTAFGRWDLTPGHEFEPEGRRLVAGGDPEDPDAEDSEDVTIGEAALHLGTRFRYTFDLGERWLHECVVDETALDAAEEYGEEPDVPVPVYGWGTVPDQYGRQAEDDEDELEARSSEALEQGGSQAFEVVTGALWGLESEQPAEALAAVAGRLRAHAGLAVPPYDLLFAAAALEPDTLPPDDTQLWLELAAGVIQPRAAAPLEPDAETAWSALEPADWAGAVIGLVRGDVGQSAEPEVVLHLITTCPEVEGEPLGGEDRDALLAGLDTVVALWQALGAVDVDRRLTALGRWGLPAALGVAWTPAS